MLLIPPHLLLEYQSCMYLCLLYLHCVSSRCDANSLLTIVIIPLFKTLNHVVQEKSFRNPPQNASAYPILNKIVAPHIESFNALFDDLGLPKAMGVAKGYSLGVGLCWCACGVRWEGAARQRERSDGVGHMAWNFKFAHSFFRRATMVTNRTPLISVRQLIHPQPLCVRHLLGTRAP